MIFSARFIKMKRFNQLACSIFAFLLVFLSFGNVSCFADQQKVTLTIYEETLRQAIVDCLPLPIQSSNHAFQGSIVLDSLDKLQIHEKSIFLHGVILGRDISMHTNIAGQNVKMALGSVSLPVTCELFFRFDRQKKSLFIKPVFLKTEKNDGDKNPDFFAPLLQSLGNREYEVPLDSLDPFLFKVGDNPVSVRFIVDDVQTMRGGALVVRMLPKVAKVH